jgi:Zinc finger, C3HC4 type (RING finger)
VYTLTETTFAMSSNGSHNRDAVLPILVNQNCYVQNVLTCTLCCEIPADPVVTPCHHVFCRACVLQALETRCECPNDRTPLRASDLRNIDGPLKRIWAQIPVQCPKCNVWKGTFESYWQLAASCTSAQEEVRQMEDKLRISETLLNEKISENKILEEKLQRTELLLEEAKRSVEGANRKHCTCKPFDPSYQYNRDNVVELAQLICLNITKPEMWIAIKFTIVSSVVMTIWNVDGMTIQSILI